MAAKVLHGWIVRARTDADTVEARANYVTRRDTIIATGAHVVATDYVGGVVGEASSPSAYQVLGCEGHAWAQRVDGYKFVFASSAPLQWTRPAYMYFHR